MGQTEDRRCPKLPTLIIIAACGLTGGAAAMLAWNAGRDQVIAADVRIGPVDVSGMTRAQARAVIVDRLLEPLDEPLVIRAAGKPFPLTAREARITADVETMIGAAVEGSRDGGVPGRTWRAISGAAAARRRAASSRLADRRSRRHRADRVHRAEGHGGEARCRVSRRRDGRSRWLPAQRLQGAQAGAGLPDRRRPGGPGDAGRALQDPEQGRRPCLACPELRLGGPLAGTVIPSVAPDNPIKARWLGIYDGVGVHGTDARGSIGSNASHGCIRMLVEDVEKLYDQVPVGTPIFIH